MGGDWVGTSDINEGELLSVVYPVKEKWLWLAQMISRFSNPLYIAPPLFLFVAFSSASDFIHGMLWWAVTIIGVSVIPYVFIRWGVRRCHYSDFHVSRREQRLVPLILAVGCMGVSMLILVWINASAKLMATMTSMIITFVVALAITQLARWKISLHLFRIRSTLGGQRTRSKTEIGHRTNLTTCGLLTEASLFSLGSRSESKM